MAFRPEQDIRGAEAYEKAVADPSYATTALNLGTSILKSFGNAPATKGPTQTDRDRDLFKNTLIKAKDAETKEPLDNVIKTFAPIFASLGMNDEERALVEQLFGPDIFVTPKAVKSEADLEVEIFSKIDPNLQLARIQSVKGRVLQETGENISDSEAGRMAAKEYSFSLARTNQAIMRANTDWLGAYPDSIATLDDLADAYNQILSIEGERDFDISQTLQLGTLVDTVLSQKAFQEPANKMYASQYAEIKKKKDTLLELRETLKDFDDKQATQKQTAFMARMVLSAEGEGLPLLAALKDNPVIAEEILGGQFANAEAFISTYVEGPKVTFTDLEFSPELLSMLGESPTPEGETKPTINMEFPENLIEEHASILPKGTNTKQDKKRRASFFNKLNANRDAIDGYFVDIVNKPTGAETFKTDMIEQAYLLSKITNPSAEHLDSLNSRKNMQTLNLLERSGENGARDAEVIRLAMKAAVDRSKTLVVRRALGLVRGVDNLRFNRTDGDWSLADNEFGQKVSALANRYGMNVGELLALGTRARQTLQVKLVAEGVFPQPDGTFFEGAISRGGRLSDKAPQSFKAFYQAAEILKSEEFVALSEEFEPVADTPKRIKQLDKYRQQLGYSPIQYAIAEDMFEQQQQPDQETDTSSPVTEAEFVPQAQLGQQVQGGFGRPIPTQFSGGAATIEQEPVVETTPVVDTVETTPVDRTLTSEQQNSISNVSEITKASNEPITTRAGTYSFTKTNKAIEKSVKNPIKQALLKGTITVETGGAGPVSERPYPYAQAARIPVWKARMDAVGLGPNATGEEIFNAVYADRNGNGDYASGDGNRYRGRGLIQITGKTTYQSVQDILQGQGIDINLIGNPDLANDNKYALPVALAFLEYAGLDDTSVNTITTNRLNDFINSGASREIAEDRWEEVIDLLELAGMQEKAEELELRNEYAAQEKAGTTADGDIGPNSRTAMTNYLTQQGVPIPQNISDDDLVILVNRN